MVHKRSKINNTRGERSIKRTVLLGLTGTIPGIILFIIINLGQQQELFETSPYLIKRQVESRNGEHAVADLFQSENEMTWELPSEISQRRYAECDGQKVSKTGGFCLTKESNKKVRYAGADPTLASFLETSVFAGKTVVDLGAGKGYYGTFFRRTDSPVAGWVGYDGALNVEEVTSGLVRFMDLTQPDAADTRPCVKGDWVLSLEVGEHIDRKYMESYLRNLRCHSREGAVISWARPTQTGGLNHVNMMEDDDVDKALARWGFVKDTELTRQARNSASFSHFKNTASVYRVRANETT